MAFAILITCLVILFWGYYHSWWTQMKFPQSPRILMYHMVEAPELPLEKPNLAVSPKEFEKQIKWLKENGWQFVTISELLRKKDQSKTIAITFDDGYKNNLTNALPILASYGAKATLYLIAGGQSANQNPHPSAHLLSDEQVTEILNSGLIELGAHSFTHRNLKTSDEASRQYELAFTKNSLEERFGKTISSFAYPFGQFDLALAEMVEKEKYESAVTTNKGISTDLQKDRFYLKRIRISGKDNLSQFKTKIKTCEKK